MPFKRARFFGFRNLEDSEINLDAERVFLVGENGQGKTNFLEALYYLCYGSSFRGLVDSLISREGTSGFGLQADMLRTEGGLDLVDVVSIKVEGNTKDIRIHGKPLKDRKELVFRNPAVIFCHEDFSFASGDPERRRFFFDQCAGMISLSYIDSLRAYKKVLKQRNAALKVGAADLLDALDPQFIRYGRELMAAREIIHGRFQAVFPELFEHVSLLGRELSLQYQGNWPKGASYDDIHALILSKRESEMMFGTTRTGPHRDRWNFTQQNSIFTDTASTGQLRLISLILRVVQARIYADYAKTSASGPAWPVMLLDDVLLELDVGRRRRFLELLPGKGLGAQSFFTFLPEEPWKDYATQDTIVYKVENGRFKN
jgi:DNA replication and repair protein RecF